MAQKKELKIQSSFRNRHWGGMGIQTERLLALKSFKLNHETTQVWYWEHW